MMAKQSLIEMRKAQAMEEINMRLKRIEAALGISDSPAQSEPAAPEEAAVGEPEAAEGPKASRRKS